MRCKWFGHKFFYQSSGFGPTKKGIKGGYCWCKRCGKTPWTVEFKTKKEAAEYFADINAGGGVSSHRANAVKYSDKFNIK